MPLNSLPVQKWDRRARERALQQARMMHAHDPDAASQLLQQLQVEEQAACAEKTDPTALVLRETFDPLDLYARVAKFYRGWTFQDIGEMDYVQVFGCIEKAKRMQEEEQRAYNNAQSNGGHTMSEAEMRTWLPAVRKYDGPTVIIR